MDSAAGAQEAESVPLVQYEYLLGKARARAGRGYFFLVEIYCVITTALWSRDGSAAVSLHPPAASMESSVRFL